MFPHPFFSFIRIALSLWTRRQQSCLSRNKSARKSAFIVLSRDYQNGIVYVKLLGACIGCTSADATLRDGIEAILLEEVPGVIGVEQVE